jgi:hypothetical protein
MTTIKCPFCGATDNDHDTETMTRGCEIVTFLSADTGMDVCECLCNVCGAVGPIADDAELAIKAFHSPSAAMSLVRRLAAMTDYAELVGLCADARMLVEKEGMGAGKQDNTPTLTPDGLPSCEGWWWGQDTLFNDGFVPIEVFKSGNEFVAEMRSLNKYQWHGPCTGGPRKDVK